ncbi:hypothetical protein [Yinghuangia seranimata]|uniref:hypothetical protein n=1 Tax=Yinghuangia seranimata TaxID=408067 RepID=UPI00248B7420|nr:hypothetical protein [Yinghuangia seranimata]MDI2124653.1 hypothetical protein [Yinghuangia seranimata]
MSTTTPGQPAFEDLMAEVMADAERFGHREHVRLTWLAVRRCGVPGAVDLVGNGIRRTAARAGVPEKFHATMTRAWVELVGHHAAADPRDDFAAFAEANPDLLDKDLLTRFYREETLAGAPAKSRWIAPDRAAFPWERGGAVSDRG